MAGHEINSELVSGERGSYIKGKEELWLKKPLQSTWPGLEDCRERAHCLLGFLPLDFHFPDHM